MSLIVDCKSKNYICWKRDSSTALYFDDIRKYKELTPSMERELLIQVNSPNKYISEKAMHTLVECNQRFIISVARKYSSYDNFDDIIEVANEGLINAIKKFDVNSKNNRLLTYAVIWIRKYINEFLINDYKAIKPFNAYNVYTYANKIRNKFYNMYGRTPSTEEIQSILYDEYGLRISNKEDLEIITFSSIDKPVSNTDNDNETYENVGEFAVFTSNNNVYDDIVKNDMKDKVNLMLSTLDEREREVLKRYYGIDCESESKEKIGKRFSISKERIRQILSDSINKLKENSDKFKNI